MSVVASATRTPTSRSGATSTSTRSSRQHRARHAAGPNREASWHESGFPWARLRGQASPERLGHSRPVPVELQTHLVRHPKSVTHGIHHSKTSRPVPWRPAIGVDQHVRVKDDERFPTARSSRPGSSRSSVVENVLHAAPPADQSPCRPSTRRARRAFRPRPPNNVGTSLAAAGEAPAARRPPRCSIAAALPVAGVRVGLHAQGMDGHTVAGLGLLAVSIMWIVQMHLAQHAAAQSSAPAVERL